MERGGITLSGRLSQQGRRAAIGLLSALLLGGCAATPERAVTAGEAVALHFQAGEYDKALALSQEVFFEQDGRFVRRGADPSWKEAVFTLGQMYEHGRGVPKDTNRAFRHYAAVGTLNGTADDFPTAAVEACRLSGTLERIHRFCRPLGWSRNKDVPGAEAAHQKYSDALDVDDPSVALYRAAYVRERERFERALLAGANPNAVHSSATYSAPMPETVLWHLVRTARSSGDLDMIQKLLTHGADPNGGLSGDNSMIGRFVKTTVSSPEGQFRTADAIPVLLANGYRVTGSDLSSIRREVARSERHVNQRHYNMLREKADALALVTYFMQIQRAESSQHLSSNELLMLHSSFRREYGINPRAISVRRARVDGFEVLWHSKNIVDVKIYDQRCPRFGNCPIEEILRFRVKEDNGRLALYPWGALLDQGRTFVPYYSTQIRGYYEAPTTSCRTRPGTSQEIEAFVHRFMAGVLNRPEREQYEKHVFAHVSPSFLREHEHDQGLWVNSYTMDGYEILKQQGDLVEVGFVNETCLRHGNCLPHEQSTVRLRLVREDGQLYLLPSSITRSSGSLWLSYWWQTSRGIYEELDLCRGG